MTDDYKWVKPAKYYLVNFPFGDCGVSEIADNETLQEWLKDGSLEDGNVVIEAVRLHQIHEEVTKVRTMQLTHDSLHRTKKEEE